MLDMSSCYDEKVYCIDNSTYFNQLSAAIAFKLFVEQFCGWFQLLQL